ncbi:MAG: hypothetical protein J7K34_02380 [Flavobacteriaceae bacterium]|nr:hypothetical protein [Flavobacteriaceae bacterium]
MKKPINLIFVLFAISLFISCGNQKEEKDEHSKSEKEVEHQHKKNNSLILNHGELWMANIETTQGIDNMIALIGSFSNKESVEAYTKLKTSLDKEFGTILKECTMKGESHDQLHNFLIPMQELFEGLASSDLKTCKDSYDTLKNHLKEYQKYFK